MMVRQQMTYEHSVVLKREVHYVRNNECFLLSREQADSIAKTKRRLPVLCKRLKTCIMTFATSDSIIWSKFIVGNSKDVNATVVHTSA
jgi:hypothetical protein